MDDTQQSRVSDATAAATRKRRSSILKSQRPARTPFSELEFNVATPTDTAKSRRVSFSRRTGVAEFVTNEATTTWKNFYEEHNKSLESFTNDSEANASRQPVGHLGKRIFDQQFEEVEAVDFMTGLANGSLNNVNFSQQLASLECTADGKLTAPQNKFELSAFTEQSKVFSKDFTAPSIGDNSGRIDVNFSAIQQIEKDDLDEIEKDLDRGLSKMGCHGPFSNGQNMSEYIEVDLNVTHVAKNDEDMSITDTVHSPVQDISKSTPKDKKANLNNDWVADKENIAINPYAAPCEANFAVNEEPDQVLVFDGKRLTLQPDIPEKDKNYRQTLLPNSSAETPQRKTIVLNCNDDLPNFIDDNNTMNSKYENSGFSAFQEIKTDEDDISDTVPMMKPKRNTIYNQSVNMSITQALPTNTVSQEAAITNDVNATKRRTIVFNESTNNISMTEAVPVNLLSSRVTLPERHHTVVYEDDMGDISITQAVPSNILANENTEFTNKNKTMVFDSDENNISMTQALVSNILDEKRNKRKTIVFDDDACDVSFTQALPANIMLPNKQEKRRTIIYENDTGNISVTQALPTNVILSKIATNPETRGTVVNESDTSHISVTQALPANIILPDKQEKRRTIIYENDTGNISVTQALPTNFILSEIVTNPETVTNIYDTVENEGDTSNISVTQALPSNIIRETVQLGDNIKQHEDEIITTMQSLPTNITKDSETSRRRTIVYENDTGNISITQAIPTQLIPGYSEAEPIVDFNTSRKPRNKKRTTIVYDNDEGDISMTEAISANIIEEAKNERKTIIYDEDEANISMTLAISTNDYLLDRTDLAADKEDIKEVKEKVIELLEETTLPQHNRLKAVDYDVYEHDNNEIQIESNVGDDPKSTESDANTDTEMSMTTAMPTNAIPVHSSLETGKRRTTVFDSSNCDISMTRPISAKLIAVEAVTLNKTETKLLDVTAPNQLERPQSDVIVLQASTNNKKQPTASLPEQIDFYSDPSDVNMEESNHSEEASPIKQNITSSPVAPVSAEDTFVDASEEAQVKLMASATDLNINEVSESGNDALMQTESEEKKELQMNISEPSEDEDDKSLMAVLDSDSPSSDVEKDAAAATSTEMFYIKKESEAVIQTDSNVDSDEAITAKVEDKDEDFHLLKKLAELQTAVSQNAAEISNRSLDIGRDEHVKQLSRNSNRANDTQDLLDLISNITDNVAGEDNVKPASIKVEDQGETIEHRRRSVAPNRQSIALSREDLLSNISMAQAALQKSRLALDDSDSADEDTRDASVDMSKKSGRTSYEVVKTLNFDDESISETGLKPVSLIEDEEKVSPLKKNIFSESSYVQENKGNVIPTYLKCVSDGIKELMLDLVKPVSDHMPFRADGISENTSTHSNQMHTYANTYSQVELDNDEVSTAGLDIEKNVSSASGTSNSPEKFKSRAYRNQVKFACFDEMETPQEPNNDAHLHSQCHSCSHSHSPLHQRTPVKQPSPSQVAPMEQPSLGQVDPVERLSSSQVLVFDHFNPLNNVLLAPAYMSDVHKYNPSQTSETLCDSGSHLNNVSRYNHNEVPESSPKREDIYQTSYQFKQKYHFNLQSTSAQIDHSSIGQMVKHISNLVKEEEVNTMIAMRENKELLQTSSSLTLVDDAPDNENRILTANKYEHSNHGLRLSTSSLVNLAGQTADINPIDQLSGISLEDSLESTSTKENVTKGKKRIYSPSTKKHKDHRPSKDVTPKPIIKMQKISKSPKARNSSIDSMAAEKDVTETNNVHQSKSTRSKSKQTKAGQNLTVQQLIVGNQNFGTEFRHNSKSEKKILDFNLMPKSESSSVYSQSDASFTSSKNLNTMKEDNSTSSVSMGFQSPYQAPMQATPSQAGRPAELTGKPNATPSDIDSGVNIVAKIDMLPFMGSHECEWESKSSADTWSFCLLHGRLRLTIRLAHRQDNAARTRVLGYTPILNITVDTVQLELKNPVATLCVRFACETMRYIVSHTLRNPCCAKDIPPLLRRCAAVARVALRWGRAMHDAKLHLAFTLDNDGYLSLKVANVRLRSVWEVTMRIELVVDDHRSVPWPKAGGVAVTRVLSELNVADADVKRVLANTPRDWGHAPRTIWQMFKYLKSRDDNLLLT